MEKLILGTCRYCLESKKLCKAHVVPKGFNYPRLPGEGSPTLESNKPGFRSRRSQSGVYDTQILCAECDQVLGKLDGFAKRELLNSTNRKTHLLDGKPVIFEYPDCDADQLSRFVLSVLWRAAISQQEYYERVNLGPYENDIELYVKNEAPLPPKISVAVTEFVGTSMVSGRVPQLDPHSARHEGVRFWHLYANRFCFYVRTDHKQHTKYSKFTINDEAPVRSLARDFETSREYRAMKKVVRSSV